jgi:hypothetical protein
MNQLLTAGLLDENVAFGVMGAIFCGSMIVLLFGLLALRMWRYRNSPSGDFSLDSFSLARYQPMNRLLSADDLEYLASQPGCRPGTIAQFKRDRRRIFRMYLRELAADFQALHVEARKMAAACPEQHSALVGSLLGQQVTFWKALLAIEVRLMMPSHAGVDIAELIASVEALRLDIARMSVAA